MKNHLPQFEQIIKQAGLNEIVTKAFGHYYNQVITGATGLLTEDMIMPPSENNVIQYDALSKPIEVPLEKLAVIKLNGGLGTSMGLQKAKSLLKIKDDYNFLDIIALQNLHLREKTGKDIPLLLMNSFNTREDSLKYLEKYPELPLPHLPLDFLQNKFPKIKQEDLSPLQNNNDKLNWNPPGHGEIYMVMAITGVLDKLLEHGYEYAFISNSDNLGAVVDEMILTYFSEHQIPFMMEVCTRSDMDKKGGHLAQTRDGHLLLRETAQCPPAEKNRFEDVNRYKYFNTNNLWVNLKALKQKLIENDNFLPLSLIVNPKEVDSVKVYQLETAMGAAISIFDGAKALAVPRNRFAPVKKTNELLAVWSDAFTLRENYQLELADGVENPPIIHLDDHYRMIKDFEKHFIDGIPSLKQCTSLTVHGDVYFGEDMELRGDVTISYKETTKLEHQLIIG